MNYFSKITASTIFFVITASAAHAQWAVYDYANVSTQVRHQVETLAKWKQQFEQMKHQYEAITGSRGIGKLFDDPRLRSALPPDWQTLVSNVRATAAYATERKKYPTFPDMPSLNAMYDVIAEQNVTMNDLYTQSSERFNQIQRLMGEIDLAKDPAAKQDLTNRLISEDNAIQASENLATILQSKQKQELENASELASKEITCKEFNHTDC